MGYVLTVAVIGLLILIHEMGHLAAAKCVRIPIERFSVGFGPKLWAFTWRATEYRLSMVPFGGYVLPKVDSVEEFSGFPLSSRIWFSLGGPFANILAALVCISAVHAVNTGGSLQSLLIAPVMDLYKTLVQFISALPAFFGHPDKLSGIIGIVAIGGQYAAGDIFRFLNFSIILNVNLAVFNLLPLPPLDGGRILFSILQGIHKPLDRLQIPVTITGWALMALLMLYTAIKDLGRLVA